MRINHNIAALNTYRQLTVNGDNSQKSIEKLSSGLRINRAGDDAAGLAISEKMRGQIRGLDQASRNAQDSISMIQTAEGALNETHSILQRMRELAVQSSNDTNTDIDRDEIQKEVDQLLQEIDRIGNTTEFNTKKLLNGNAGFSATVAASAGVKVISGGNAGTGTLSLTSVTAAKQAEVRVGAFNSGAEALTVANATTFQVNGVDITTDGSATIAELVSLVNDKTAETGVTAKLDGQVLVFTSSQAGSAQSIDIDGLDAVITNTNTIDITTDGSAPAEATGSGESASITAAGLDAVITNGSGATIVAAGNIATVVGGTFDGLQFKVDPTANGNSGDITVTSNNSLTMQIGANETQTMSIAINDMRASALQVAGVRVDDSTTAQSAITTIQSAIEAVSAERSKLGAYQNRLEHTINNLGTASENLTASESRIRDVDMAKEMMEFTKNNILSQAAQAMLAQANQQPQGVLQLLR